MLCVTDTIADGGKHVLESDWYDSLICILWYNIIKGLYKNYLSAEGCWMLHFTFYLPQSLAVCFNIFTLLKNTSNLCFIGYSLLV